MEERRIALQQHRDECLPVLQPAGRPNQAGLDLHERRFEDPRFVLEPAAVRGQIVAVAGVRQLKDHERLPRRRLASRLPQAARMLDQELDERLPALPAIDATPQLRIEGDRALQ